MAIIIFLAILGLVCTWTGITFYRKVSKIKKWKKISAFILKKEAKHRPNKQGATHTCQYEIGIEYEYLFETKKYVHNGYSLVTSMMNEESAQKKIAKIPHEILIYVNPKNPKEAYYKVNSSWFAIIILIFGVICLVTFLLFVFVNY